MNQEVAPPYHWRQQVNDQLMESSNYSSKQQIYLNTLSEYRFLYLQRYAFYILNNSIDIYDGFEKDIANLKIFFEETKFAQYLITPSFTWSIFISNVGGIFGLFIGLSLATIFELVWLFINIINIILSRF